MEALLALIQFDTGHRRDGDASPKAHLISVCCGPVRLIRQRAAKARFSPHPSAPFRPGLQPFERVPARSVPSKSLPARKQGRNSADGCGEDRAYLPSRSRCVLTVDWRGLGRRNLTDHLC